MRKNYTRMFRKLIIMLCVYAYLDAALNFIDHGNTNTPAQSASAQGTSNKQTQTLATQVDLPVIENAIKQPQNNTPEKPIRAAAPASALEDDGDETVEFYFENADIDNLLKQISSLYNVIFITDDMVDPMLPDKKALKGNKLSFKTHKPLTKKAAWDLFLTFLEMTGFTLSTESKPNIYRITQIPSGASVKAPIPTYIGVDPSALPTNDQMIRYVYFVQNTSIATIFEIAKELKSTASGSLIQLSEMQALMISDKAYNVVSLMEIIKELDRVAMPQAMSVLKLKRADAKDVKNLYEQITGSAKDEGVASRLFPRKQPTATYFPDTDTVRIILYERTNALILLGTEDAIRKIEDFVIKHVDIDITAPYPPIRVHNLRYADANQIADIMNELTKYDADSAAAQSGGVRGEDKYLKKMKFTPEPNSNRLIIEGDETDYLIAKEILDKLDERQPQIAIEALLLSVTINDNKQLGAQIRSKVPGADGLLGSTAKFQTSGLYGTTGIQLAPDGTRGASNGANRLLANLINLAIGASAGNAVVSLGSDAYGVWGLLQALQSVSNTQIIATPFLVATNKTEASVTVGQTRRVVVATVVGAGDPISSDDDKPANLVLKVTPQINSDGMIVLDLYIQVDQFEDAALFTSATVNTKTLTTKTVVSNGEVLALGGLIQNSAQLNMSQTPILGRIPILGWLFKNRQDTQQRNNLLVLMCARILPPDSNYEADKFTQHRILAYHTSLADMMNPTINSDPINKFFFEKKNNSTERVMENFMFNRQENVNEQRQNTNTMLQKAENDQPVKNQRARKRSSRNSFGQSKKASDANTAMNNKNSALSETQEIATLNFSAQEDGEPAPGNATQKVERAVQKKSLKRSTERTRPSLSTFMDDSNMDEALS